MFGEYSINRNQTNSLITSISNSEITKEYNYNNYAELIELKNPTFSYNLQRDNLGLITKKDETINNKTISCTYTYDKLNRLIKVTKDNQTVEEYSYEFNQSVVII